MTTIKRNDATGHIRGQGDYSKSHPKLANPGTSDRKVSRAAVIDRVSGHGLARKVKDADSDYD